MSVISGQRSVEPRRGEETSGGCFDSDQRERRNEPRRGDRLQAGVKKGSVNLSIAKRRTYSPRIKDIPQPMSPEGATEIQRKTFDFSIKLCKKWIETPFNPIDNGVGEKIVVIC